MIMIVLHHLLLPLLVLIVFGNRLDSGQLVGLTSRLIGIVQVYIVEDFSNCDPISWIWSEHLFKEVDGVYIGHSLLLQVLPQTRCGAIAFNLL